MSLFEPKAIKAIFRAAGRLVTGYRDTLFYAVLAGAAAVNFLDGPGGAVSSLCQGYANDLQPSVLLALAGVGWEVLRKNYWQKRKQSSKEASSDPSSETCARFVSASWAGVSFFLMLALCSLTVESSGRLGWWLSAFKLLADAGSGMALGMKMVDTGGVTALAQAYRQMWDCDRKDKNDQGPGQGQGKRRVKETLRDAQDSMERFVKGLFPQPVPVPVRSRRYRSTALRAKSL